MSVDTSTPLQVMQGLEVTAWIGQFDTPYQIENVHLWEDEVAMRAIDEVGVDRLRLESWTGTENPVDYFTQYIEGQISRNDWKLHWYESINDNSDPLVIDPAGFQWSLLDYNVDHVAEPLRGAAAAAGHELRVSLCLVDFGASAFNHADDADEYAELILAAFQHLDATYGWVPDAVEVILEPDLADDWQSSADVAAAIAATGPRLAAAGYAPDFIAPSTTSMSNALSYFDAMIGNPDVAAYLTELSYHRYTGVSESTLMQIASRGEQYGIRTGMLEWWSNANGVPTLIQDLTTGRNSSWQSGVLAGIGTGPDDGLKLFYIDDSIPSSPTVHVNRKTRYLRQYFQKVGVGAIRTEATSTDGTLAPVAFERPDGAFVVVVDSERSGVVTFDGLPDDVYMARLASASTYETPLPVAGGSGQPYLVDLPEAGVLLLYGSSSSSHVPESAEDGPITPGTMANSVHISQNPWTDRVELSWAGAPSTATGELRLYDSSGREILHRSTGTRVELTREETGRGHFFYQWTVDGVRRSGRFVSR